MRDTANTCFYAMQWGDTEDSLLVLEVYDDEPRNDEEVVLGSTPLCSLTDIGAGVGYAMKLFSLFPVERVFATISSDSVVISYVGELLDHDEVMTALGAEKTDNDEKEAHDE